MVIGGGVVYYCPARIIDTTSEDVVDGVKEETGGQGVDCVLDVRQLDVMDARMVRDVVTCLGVNGTWITMYRNLQVCIR